MHACIFIRLFRKLGMKKEDLLNIECFVKNKNISKSLSHFCKLYKIIEAQFPDYQLPHCDHDIV